MKIGIVSALEQEITAISRMLKNESLYNVVWSAATIDDAIAQASVQPPDVLLLSIAAAPAASDGVRRIMSQAPTAILILAASINGQAGPIFDALGAGALDVVNVTDENGTPLPDGSAALMTKLDLVRRLGRHEQATRGMQTKRSNTSKPANIVLIGASAGGPAALAAVLSRLPAGFNAPVVIVQHIDDKFAGGMAEWLAEQCALPVRLAQDRERMENGVVYVAGRSEHLVLCDRHTLCYRAEPREHSYKPSIDELFFSAAKLWKNAAVGVLLTGMGQDGAAGLRMLRDAGAVTIAQDQETSVVYGIPKAAARMNAAVYILPLDRIAAQIGAAVNSTRGLPS